MLAQIREISKNKAICQRIELKENYNELPYALHLIVAPTKNMSRYEWMVEKSTEIGVTSISPIICQRSERKHLRLERLEKIALSAMKQSLKATQPLIKEPQAFGEWLYHLKGQKIVCSGSADQHFSQVLDKDQPVNLLIGPEGDFTEDEMTLAANYGFIPVNLGQQRLRTETAAVVASALVASLSH